MKVKVERTTITKKTTTTKPKPDEEDNNDDNSNGLEVTATATTTGTRETSDQLDFLPADLSATISTTTTPTATRAATTTRNLILHPFDGMQSAPTLTTPTLTPTTLRSIDETFYELTGETNNSLNVPFQAGFKPPPLAPLPNSGPVGGIGSAVEAIVSAGNTLELGHQPNLDVLSKLNYSNSIVGSDSDDSNASWNDQHRINGDTTDTSSGATDSTSYQNNSMLGNGSNGSGANNFTGALAANQSTGGRGANNNSNTNTSNSATPAARRGGGRRPNKAFNMTPEEEEKRRIRRERNKAAAARCRKRRVDQTNDLTEEVDALVKKGDTLKAEITMLTELRNQLKYVIEAHLPTCPKVRDDILSVSTCNGLIGPAALHSTGGSSCGSVHSNHSHNNNNNNSNDSSSGTITGFDATLNSTGRSHSPLDLKPVHIDENLLLEIKHEPLDNGLESESSSLDQDGPPPPKRAGALPTIAQLTASLTTPTNPNGGSLNTPIVSQAPVSFAAFAANANANNPNSPTLNLLNKGPKARPNTLAVQRPFAAPMQLNAAGTGGVDGKGAPIQIQGVPIQTPSTGVFNFDSLMDGGTGLTPVSGPLIPNCSSQNKHPLELPTPTTEPSKLCPL
ncbi:transcription factor kayak isoform X3 [Drosophila tropicalis]|uniref:transcription factor kayak isoform X3 n=1 Tax=Drosophila tropicalis TaxID=46794 RepID=UPI0035AB7980